MKRAIIIHCWGGSPEYCWYPWVKRELLKADFEVQVPEMPDTVHPKLTGWLPKLAETVGEPDEDTYLIGHSIGCATIMRYLEQLALGEKIGGVVFVAGYLDYLGYKELENFFVSPMNFEKIRSHCDKFVDIASDDDPYVALKEAELLKKELGAEIILKKGMKHFDVSVERGESCTELPDVVEAVLRLTR